MPTPRGRTASATSAPPSSATPSLTFGLSLIGALGRWRDHEAAERALTVLMSVPAGLGVRLSVSIALDRRIAALLLLSGGLALARRSVTLGSVQAPRRRPPSRRGGRAQARVRATVTRWAVA